MEEESEAAVPETAAYDAEEEDGSDEEHGAAASDTVDASADGAAGVELSAGTLAEPERAHQPPSSSAAATGASRARRVSYREARPYTRTEGRGSGGGRGRSGTRR